MNILNIDKKQKEISFICHTIEDLWIIKSISDSGDYIKGPSFRRLKINDTGVSERKPVFVKLEIEKKDFSSTLNSLRFTGKIVFSKPVELAPIGEYHTIEVDFKNKFTLEKKELFSHQIDLLKKSKSFVDKITIVILDDEFCDIYSLSGVEKNHVATLSSQKHGKRYNKSFDFSNYFQEIYSIISKLSKNLIVAGPGITKNDFLKFIKEKHKLSGFVVNLSSISKSSINELFLKKEVLDFFKNSIIFKEQEMVEKFKENLGKDNGLFSYGLKEIESLIQTGACEFILISRSLWLKDIERLQKLIKDAESIKTKVHVLDESNKETELVLNSFGGIVSVLRYKVN